MNARAITAGSVPDAAGPRAYEAVPGCPPGYSPVMPCRILVAVEVAATEARKRRERGERDDKAEQVALGEHCRKSFRGGFRPRSTVDGFVLPELSVIGPRGVVPRTGVSKAADVTEARRRAGVKARL